MRNNYINQKTHFKDNVNNCVNVIAGKVSIPEMVQGKKIMLSKYHGEKDRIGYASRVTCCELLQKYSDAQRATTNVVDHGAASPVAGKIWQC